MEKPKLRPSKENRQSGDSKIMKENNLRKGVLNTIKSLQELNLELTDADKVLDAARDASATITRLQQENCELTETIARSKSSDQTMQASFADNCLRLSSEFQTRRTQLEQEHQSILAQEKIKMNSEVAALQSALDSERQKNHLLMQRQADLRTELETQHGKERNTWTRDRDVLQKKVDQGLYQKEETSRRLVGLRGDVEDQKTIVRGREKEKEILQRRLAEYEAFEVFDSESLCTMLKDLRQRVSAFGDSCLEKAELLPEWNRIPEGLHKHGFPLHLNIATEEGRQFFTALLQNAVVSELMTNVFSSAPSCSCNEMNAIASMMHSQNPAFEAIWRQMAAAAILREPKMAKGLHRKLSQIADKSITSWRIQFSEKSRSTIQQQLANLLYECQNQWLQWMRLKERLRVCSTGSAASFTHDSTDIAEDVSKLPGDFNSTPHSTPVLCKFPAFFTSSRSDKVEDTLMFKGEAIYASSPMLLKVIDDANCMTSSRISRK